MSSEERFRPLGDKDIERIRYRMARGWGLPYDLAARLLADRDAWAERAWRTLDALDDATGSNA